MIQGPGVPANTSRYSTTRASARTDRRRSVARPAEWEPTRRAGPGAPSADEPGHQPGPRRQSDHRHGEPQDVRRREAPDHQQLEVDPDDLPPSGEEDERERLVQHDDGDRAEHDRHHAVERGAEQVVADPHADARTAWSDLVDRGLDDRFGAEFDDGHRHSHRSTRAIRRLATLTMNDVTATAGCTRAS